MHSDNISRVNMSSFSENATHRFTESSPDRNNASSQEQEEEPKKSESLGPSLVTASPEKNETLKGKPMSTVSTMSTMSTKMLYIVESFEGTKLKLLKILGVASYRQTVKNKVADHGLKKGSVIDEQTG